MEARPRFEPRSELGPPFPAVAGVQTRGPVFVHRTAVAPPMGLMVNGDSFSRIQSIRSVRSRDRDGPGRCCGDGAVMSLSKPHIHKSSWRHSPRPGDVSDASVQAT